MRCEEVMRELAGGRGELRAEARAHMQTCPACAELVSAVEAARAEAPAPDSMRTALEEIQSDLRPVRQIWPAWINVSLMVGAVMLSLGVALLPGSASTAGWQALGLVRGAVLEGAVLAAVVLLAMVASRLMVPGSGVVMGAGTALMVTGVAVMGLVVALIPETPHARFARTAAGCFRLGLPYGLAAAMISHLVIRAGAPLTKGVAGLTAGVLGGAAGLAFLEVHCPLLDVGHVMAGHVSIPVVCGVLGALVARWTLEPGGGRRRRDSD